MKNILILSVLVLGFVANSYSQKDFDKLSGKAKAKVAKKEKREAKKDQEYQLMMDDAHSKFASKEYHDALALYEKAQERRPLNIYPKVKIEDVLLAMQNQPEDETLESVFQNPLQIENTRPGNELENQKEERVEQEFDKEIKKAEEIVKEELPPPPKETKVDEPKVDKVIIEKEEDIKPLTESELRKDLGNRYEDGVHENTFTEGNKEITERIVVKDGLGDLYRRVQYKWGAFYFKNNKSVTKNTWDQSYK